MVSDPRLFCQLGPPNDDRNPILYSASSLEATSGRVNPTVCHVCVMERLLIIPHNVALKL